MVYFVHKEHGMVQAVQPLLLGEVPSILCGDIVIHILHEEEDAMVKVL